MASDLGTYSNRKIVYVARYDYPQYDVKEGQEFHRIDDIPANVAVTPVAVGS